MAQTGFTPIQLYYSSTTTNAPLAANLASGELAINITDGKLFYKDNANAVQVIGWKVVPATAGGTGQTSYAVGDLLYADTTTSLAKLPDVATGNALISGGVGVAPSWGKIGLTTHVSGTLGVGNGGTGQSSNLTQYGVIYGSTTTAMASTAAGTSTQVLHGNASGAPTWSAVSLTADVTGTLGIGNGGTGQTSFTAGYIHFGSFSTTSNLFWDNTNFRLGLNNSSPGYTGDFYSSATTVLNLRGTLGGNYVGQSTLRFDNRNSNGSLRPSIVEGLMASNDNGSQLAFATCAASSTLVESARIDNSQYFLIGYTSSNGAYRLQVNSQIFATSSTIATSDARYKENFTPLTNALSLVRQLEPGSFDWKKHPIHGFDTSTRTIGFKAQQVRETLKDQDYVNSIVKSNTCVLEPEEYDKATGEKIKDAVTEEFLGIAEGNMVALLAKAISELADQFEAYKATHP
jgi:hypothetical protein